MAKLRLRWGLAVLAASVVYVGAAAQRGAPMASNAWVKLPAAGETTTQAFASIENPGMYDAYLVSASSDVAGKIEFRDAGKGAAAIEEVTLPQHDTLFMDPKGLHMFLSELKRPLKEGDTVAITLTTELGVKIEVSAKVKSQ